MSKKKKGFFEKVGDFLSGLFGKKPKKPTHKKKSPSKKTTGKKSKNFVGKIGHCDGATLGLDKGHYVFIREVKKDKCTVNTITSLKYKNGKINAKKIDKIETGEIYPIPKKDLTLSRFSGVHNNVIENIPVDKITGIGQHTLDKKHHEFIQKNVKK